MDSNTIYIEPLTLAAIQRAETADPNGRRCLIENRSRCCAIEVAHVMGRTNAYDSRQIGALEWSWKKEKHTLNLDTRRNVFFCGASLHQLYKERKWALLPEPSDVEQYFGWAMPFGRNQFPINNEPTFQYTFLPLQDMEDVYLTRQRDLDPSDSHGQQKPVVDIYHYPFTDFPKITSHVHPTFAIIHLGSIVSSETFNYEIRMSLYQKYPFLEMLCDLHDKWIGFLPSTAEEDPTYITQSRASEAQDSLSLSPNRDSTPHCRLVAGRIEMGMNDEVSSNSSSSSPPSAPNSSSSSSTSYSNSSDIPNPSPPRRIQPPRASKTKMLKAKTVMTLPRPPIARGRTTQLTSQALHTLNYAFKGGRSCRRKWTMNKINAWAKRSKASISTIGTLPAPPAPKVRSRPTKRQF
ncbi:hypothetical protein CVT24_011656 [Panaeolus cyanescens]|uniref:HNH nuclease domain-containing protein n=1 Tax=Panaeolus cyanescens TaxID=181874 RepID=A0A409WE90_9AGAR|nr:hypothetical protein CVT24_011656 [Panaeolus cyanescens]